jgi:hypothetical protein
MKFEPLDIANYDLMREIKTDFLKWMEAFIPDTCANCAEVMREIMANTCERELHNGFSVMFNPDFNVYPNEHNKDKRTMIALHLDMKSEKDEIDAQCIDMWRRGEKLRAVKHYKDKKGVGLREAKESVERLMGIQS